MQSCIAVLISQIEFLLSYVDSVPCQLSMSIIIATNRLVLDIQSKERINNKIKNYIAVQSERRQSRFYILYFSALKDYFIYQAL